MKTKIKQIVVIATKVLNSISVLHLIHEADGSSCNHHDKTSRPLKIITATEQCMQESLVSMRYVTSFSQSEY